MPHPIKGAPRNVHAAECTYEEAQLRQGKNVNFHISFKQIWNQKRIDKTIGLFLTITSWVQRLDIVAWHRSKPLGYKLSHWDVCSWQQTVRPKNYLWDV